MSPKARSPRLFRLAVFSLQHSPPCQLISSSSSGTNVGSPDGTSSIISEASLPIFPSFAWRLDPREVLCTRDLRYWGMTSEILRDNDTVQNYTSRSENSGRKIIFLDEIKVQGNVNWQQIADTFPYKYRKIHYDNDADLKVCNNTLYCGIG